MADIKLEDRNMQSGLSTRLPPAAGRISASALATPSYAASVPVWRISTMLRQALAVLPDDLPLCAPCWQRPRNP